MNDLRKIAVFSDLTADQLGWLAGKFEEIRLAPGEIFVRPGDPAVWLAVILEGEVRWQRAGRTVIELIPEQPWTDFNDLVLAEQGP